MNAISIIAQKRIRSITIKEDTHRASGFEFGKSEGGVIVVQTNINRESATISNSLERILDGSPDADPRMRERIKI